MSTQVQQSTGLSAPTLTHAIRIGALSGLAGGIVFGAMMSMMGMLPMVGQLIGRPNAVIGLVVHLAISAFIGAVYGLAVAQLRLPISAMMAWLGGAINGVIWWVLGALILMPAQLGMTDMIFVVGQAQWLSLMGHLVYGIVTALVFNRLTRR